MRPKDRAQAGQLETRLLWFSRNRHRLPGIRARRNREAFIEQVLESIRRVQFVAAIRGRSISSRRTDPDDEIFDPLRAAISHQRTGNIDEAFWLIFLFVHFGKNRRGGWRYAREVYGRLGAGARWDWFSTSSNPKGFRDWLRANEATLRRVGVPGGFGNHRKYQTLDADGSRGTGAAFEGYVSWVAPPRTHTEVVEDALAATGNDHRAAFDYLYTSMQSVPTFGRTARFDYLTMLGKLELAPIEPGSAYLQGSTGPLSGARLLFGPRPDVPTLDKWLIELGGHLGLGMQVLEDALCNWQKSPNRFKPFRG